MTNSDEVRNNTNTSKNDTLVLQREFDMYCIWKSLPPMIISPNKGTVDEVLEQLRIDDPILIELAKLRTQGDFAKHFNVSPDTLTDWNKLINKRDTLADIRVWAKRLSKNVILSMYNNAMKSDVKLNSIPQRDEYIYMNDKYYDVLNVVHSIDKNHKILALIS